MYRIRFKLFAFLLVLIFTMSLFPYLRVNADVIQSGTCGDDVTWEFDNEGVLTIAGTGDMKDYSSSSPAPWRSYSSSVKSLVILPGVTSVGDYAFDYCYNLTSVTLPEGLTSIGEAAFQYCWWLPEINIPNSVTSIGNKAFYNCSAFKEITFPDGITSIGDQVLDLSYIITSITIPASVTSIGKRAFGECRDLTEITIPGNVTSIGQNAFTGCNSLKNVYYLGTKEQFESIGYSFNKDVVFHYGDNPLKILTQPIDFSGLKGSTATFRIDVEGEDLTYQWQILSDGTWENSTESGANTSTITFVIAYGDNGKQYRCVVMDSYGNGMISNVVTVFDSSVKSSGTCGDDVTWEFDNEGVLTIAGTGDMKDYSSSSPAPWRSYSSSVKSLVILPGVTSVGDYAFDYCYNLTSVTLPEGLTSIGEAAFQYCWWLPEINIPNSVTSIGNKAFYNCSAFKEITFPDGITSIGDQVLDRSYIITSITIPASVTSIGKRAFGECRDLPEITIPENVKSISSDAFTGCNSLTDVYYLGTSEQFESIGYSFDKSVIIHYAHLVNVSSVTGGTVEVSENKAFEDNQITVTAIPEIGYELDTIKVDDTVIEGNTFAMPDHDVTVNVTFKKSIYTVSVSNTENGTATVNANTASYGDTITITATPAEGFDLDVIKVNGTAIEGTTFTMPALNVIVTVIFKKADYTITVSGTENGTTTVNTNIANYGDQITITAVPDEGCEVFDIRVNGEKINDLSFVMPAKSVTIKVSYKKIDYTVTLSSAVNGTATVSKTIANIGDVITVTATPADGYSLDTIKVNGTAIECTTFTMPAQAVTVEVTFKKNAPAKNGWILDNGKYYYYDNGVMVTGWKSSGGKWYYMDPETGIMVTGWLDLDGTWYYLNGSGAMTTGWTSIRGKWYYFDNSGAMYTGWVQSSGKWYYLTSSGAMATGWQAVGSEWYYFESSGAMTEPGWKEIDGNWYYFKKSGAMAANEYCGGYWLGKDGSWTYPHKATWRGNATSGWWYGDDTGWYAKNETLRIDGKDYNFNSSGYCTNP